jgi:DNA repair exonuclease SbcCD ATPase subunit
MSDERLRQGYNTVLTTLQPAEAAKAGPRRGAAASIAAQAQLGLAALALNDAIDAELACSRKQTDIRKLQNHWTGFKSLQASLGAFDPAAEIARLEEERTARAAEITAAQQQLAATQAELEAMRTRITSLEEQARSRWREETEIRQGAVDLGEVERSPVIEEANQVKRQGDAFDRQASETRALLESQEPALRDIEAEIDRLTTQSEQFSQDIEALRAEHAERQRLATEAADEAAALAGVITGVVEELSDLRDAVPAAWKAVADACDAARSEATVAVSTARDMAQIQIGSAEQMRADALAHQAAGSEAHASTMQMLASTQPPLPAADEYAEAAEAAGQKAEELRGMAEAAYRDAADAFETMAGDQDRVAGAMADLTSRLRAKAGSGEPAIETDPQAGQPEAPEPDAEPQDPETAG